MAITIKEEGSEAYVRVTAKAGSYQAIRCTVLVVQEGEHKARETRYTWRQLEV